jgi:16S rRNA (guanine527-N7)-methyltransferase
MDRDRNPKSDDKKSSDSSKDSNRRDDRPLGRPSKPSDNPYKRNDRDKGSSSDKPYSRDDRPKYRTSKPSDSPYKRDDRSKDRPSDRPYSRDDKPKGRSSSSSDSPYKRDDRSKGRPSDRPYNRDDRPKGRSSTSSDSPYKRDDRSKGRPSDRPYNRDDRPKGRSSTSSDSPYKRDDRSKGRPSDRPYSRDDRPKDRYSKPSGKPSFGSFRKPGGGSDRPDRSSDSRREDSRRDYKPARRKIIPNSNLPKCLKQTAEEQLVVTSESVKNVLNELKLEVSKDQFSSLLDYLLLVKTLNEDINLVSRVDVDAILLRSLWESLIPALKQDWRRGPNIMDLGTGGGFPGIPLSIALTDSSFTLIDSRRAKTLALKQAQKDLSLSNVEVIHERAEVFSSHTETLFDSITVRAVGIMKEVLTWSEPLLKSGGTLLAWKGPEGLKELEFLNADRWKLIDTLKVLPHRSVYVLEHTK